MSAAATAAPSLRALLKGIADSRHEKEDAWVELISRTGNDKITVRYSNGRYRAVARHRLFAVDNRKHRLRDDLLGTLPWSGSGADPLEPPHAPPYAQRGEVPCNQGGGVMSNATEARLPATGLATLPWNGKGADPMQAPPKATRPHTPPYASARGEVPGNPGGGVMSNTTVAHDPSVADYRDTSPPSAGRRA